VGIIHETEQGKLTPERNSAARDFKEQTQCNHTVESRAPVPKVILQKVGEEVPSIGATRQRYETSENLPIY
jgi:hypothetical protein